MKTRKTALGLAIVLLVMSVQPVFANESDWKLILGPHIRMDDVAYGNGVYVAVGWGAILTSADSKEWTPTYEVDANGVVWNGSIFVAVGENSILTSPDGWNWTERSSGKSSFEGVTWGDGQFVAVGGAGNLYTSVDGFDWIRRDSGTDQWLHSVTWGNGTYVAVGFETILTSPDGENWTEHQSPIRLFGVSWLNDQFFAMGDGILLSSDARHWTQLDFHPDSFPSDIVWTGSKYVIVGLEGLISTSVDGLTWKLVDSGTTEPLTAIVWDGGQLVAVGWGCILTSPDGNTWSSRSGPVEPLYGLTWTGSEFFAVGEWVYSSPDGLEWTREDWDIVVPLLAVAWGNDSLVAVGCDDAGGSHIFTLREGQLYCPGIDWLVDVSWGNDRFAAISAQDALVYTSFDGITWEDVTVSHGANSITWGNNLFAIAANQGYILTSPDGKDWTTYDSGVEDNLRGIVCGDNQFVAVGENGTVLSSPDGINWSKHESGTNSNLWSVAWGNGLFVAVGGGIVIVSPDGKDWYESPSGVGFWLSDVTWGNDTFIISGDHGSVLYAPADILAARCTPKPDDQIPDEPDNPDVPDNPKPSEPNPQSLSSFVVFGGIGTLALLLLGAGILIARKKSKAKQQ